jgi:hypothetical protein
LSCSFFSSLIGSRNTLLILGGGECIHWVVPYSMVDCGNMANFKGFCNVSCKCFIKKKVIELLIHWNLKHGFFWKLEPRFEPLHELWAQRDRSTDWEGLPFVYLYNLVSSPGFRILQWSF